MMHLDMVMRILQKHKLFAKLSNCSFAQDDLMFFGHVVGQNGLRVDPKEMCLLSKIGLQSFLELTIQIMIGSAALAHPLRHLSKESVRSLWTKECKEACEGVRYALCTVPVLVLPDWSKRFEVICDACAAPGRQACGV